ncbi:MAG: lysylphosphatidylglycerol synthase transmembrane domain-containing protein [Prevotella sp.]|nr:lysylphosphatidylglycerol synthase transmembrane domain-containing protein [Prevotella sp.]
MKRKYQNIFFVFGLAVLALMVTQLDFAQVCSGLQRAGYWFLAVIALWFFLYMFNTASWYVIINNAGKDEGHKDNKVAFWWLYKITVSGFALNYATPGGLMGGEPYRIMSLAPKIGTQRASSSVILFAMTHVFSHFWFWFLSAVTFVIVHQMDTMMSVLMGAVIAFAMLAIWLFVKGYKRGITVSCMNMLSRFPLVKKWAQGFFDKHRGQLENIDRQMAILHNQNPKAFVGAVMLELLCRIFSALEIYFILLVIMPSANFIDCVLILAFTSLFANMLFFLPLQLGGREGGFLMSAKGLALSSSAGIFVALIVRVRELIWTAIGLLLIKFDKKS